MNTQYRAILLSAGFGTRLRPLTLTTPKCLVEIDNEPLLNRWLRTLNNKVDSVIINTHYLHEKVDKFLKQKNFSFNIIQSYEKELLGTAGTLIKNADFFNGFTGLLIHSDNYSDFNLSALLESHKNRPSECLMTMLVFETQEPSKCGIVEIDENKILKAFYEKNLNPPGNLANGAIYVFDNDLIRWIQKNHPKAKDFSNDIIPFLLNKIYTHKTNSTYLDIGSPDSLKIAQQISKDMKY